ncbi:LytR/AlgR family response regulator transcription factor [Flavobacterium sp. RHBU_3]|uniref:LytR/AlgR family response regulator transcription factor n=1 Tax=Flavobacterium sp. RHBU_3 TaxID=3391184 RepID=UPI0039855206
MTTVLIIEDEVKTARQLARLIEDDGDFTVSAIMPSVKEACEWLLQHTPGLIFSDIQLADGLSFEIFRRVPVKAPVIFCTAYDQYAINAFETNGIDYLLKPIEIEKLQKSLQKFRDMKSLFIPEADYAERMGNTLAKIGGSHKTSLLIHHRERIIPLKLEDVHYVHAEAGIVTLHVQGGMRYHVSYTLEEMEGMMNPQLFFKVNRQFIINRKAMDGAEHYFSRRLLVSMNVKTPCDIIVSKARVQAFLVWMES